VRDEWQLDRPIRAVPLYAQTGDDRYANADKMILKSVSVIPHGLINTPDLVGEHGDRIVEYIEWLVQRVAQLRTSPDYVPVIHLDLYGQLGVVAGGDIATAVEILHRMEAAAGAHELRIEHPFHAENRDDQIELYTSLTARLRERGAKVGIIADEWANTAEDIHLFAERGAVDLIQIKTPDLGSVHHTVDAILDCQKFGIGTVLGGTCAETDQSARVTTHIGLATGVTQMLAKPGMGVDEGLMIVTNEMHRALALHAALPDRA